ncbi:MAG TPA: L-asparaginase 1, partial [Prevotella sp.]|nr:L-asparaginase 1 [Prevotella sp.]
MTYANNVLLIYTGGTIGMNRNPRTGALEPFKFEHLLSKVPELNQFPTNISTYQFNPPIDSSDMSPKLWIDLTHIIANNYNQYDGFVILHGTDTMAYTASALSFMLEGLAKPVILTGSQIPMCEIRSDGRDNLITSLLIAGAEEVHEVCLYFGGKLLRGNRATKFSADGLIAFLSPNYPSLADAGMGIRYNESALLPKPKGALKLQLLENIPIGVLKVFPGIQFSLFEQIMTE